MFPGGLRHWDGQEELCKRGGGRNGEEPDVEPENAEVSGGVIAHGVAACGFMVPGRRWWLMYRCHWMRLTFRQNTSALLGGSAGGCTLVDFESKSYKIYKEQELRWPQALYLWKKIRSVFSGFYFSEEFYPPWPSALLVPSSNSRAWRSYIQAHYEIVNNFIQQNVFKTVSDQISPNKQDFIWTSTGLAAAQNSTPSTDSVLMKLLCGPGDVTALLLDY